MAEKIKIAKVVSDLRVAERLIQTKQSADHRRIHFSLSFRRLKQLMMQKNCYYTGVPFNPGINGMTMSLDRVDNTKGYTDNNVVACLSSFNSLKSHLTIPQILMMSKKVQTFIKKHQINVPVHKKTVPKAAVAEAPSEASKDGDA